MQAMSRMKPTRILISAPFNLENQEVVVVSVKLMMSPDKAGVPGETPGKPCLFAVAELRKRGTS